MRQHLSFREHFRRGNAPLSRLTRYNMGGNFGTRNFFHLEYALVAWGYDEIAARPAVQRGLAVLADPAK